MGEKLVHKSIIVGPGGEFNFHYVEDVEEIAKDNQAIRDFSDGFSADRSRRMNVSVPPRLYYYWAHRLGEECWQDRNFIKSFIRENPQYATVDIGSI